MSKMNLSYLWVLFVIYGYTTCGEEMEVEEHQEEVIRLGLHFVYDKACSDRALFKVNRSYNAYFTALTRAAQEFFKLHDDPKIMLTLVRSSKLEEEYIINNTITTDHKLNASETLDKLRTIMTWNDTLDPSVNVVFLATGKDLLIKESWMTGEWYGLAYTRSICFGNASVGIVHDDGATFNGVRLTALQIALLDGKRGLCWNDKPKPALQNFTNFPVDFYKLFDCDQCHVAEHFKITLENQ